MITILTNPIPSLSSYYRNKFKEKVRPILRKIDGKEPLVSKLYGGHFAVTRSLIEGLVEIGAAFKYNPQRVSELTEVVVVLSGLDTLEQAISFKKNKQIKYLFAGPNLVILPTDASFLIGNTYIDKLIVNSLWIKNLYGKLLPILQNKMIIWPAGVNEKFWNSNKKSFDNKHSLLFYNKRPEENLYKNCMNKAKENGFNVIEIIYGKYNVEEYKFALQQSGCLVHFVEQESQGLSLVEAWAMDVPTLVWNPGFYHATGLNFNCSSAPYLSEKTGDCFKEEKEFENCLLKLKDNSYTFSPRNWVLNNMTDAIVAQKLLNLVSSSC
jgi:hypothetical protein